MIRRRHGGGLAAALASGALLILALGDPAGAATARQHGTQSLRTPTAASAAAAERPAVGAGALIVRIAAFEPDVPEAGDTLSVSGTITNTSSTPVTDVAAVLRMSPSPLPSRQEIPEVLAGAGTRLGERVGDEVALTRSLGPGRAIGFDLRVAVEDLDLASPGVYVTGVEARGSTGDGVVRQDIDRTFLCWWPEGTTAKPLLLTTLWPLSAVPSRDATGVLLDETPAIDMSPAGRLSALLQAAAEHPGAVSLVVDPNTVDAAAQMADGYQVRTDKGVVKGTRSDEVATWLEQVRAAVADDDVDAVAMLNGQPDVVAAQRGRVLGTLLRQRPLIDEQTELALDTALPATMALVPGGRSDAATLARLAAARIPVTVLSDQAMSLTPATYFTPSGSVMIPTDSGGLPALLTDSGLSDALAMPMGDQAEQTAVRQRLLAETLTTVMELPETERLLVMAPATEWSPTLRAAQIVVDVAEDTPWLVPTTIAAALAREPSDVPRSLAEYGTEQQDAELPAAQVAAARRQFRGLTEYASVLSEAGALPAVTRTAPNRVVSGWFRSEPARGDALTDAVSDQVAASLESVRIVSSGSITVSGASGTIPITVENLGSVPVTVGLRMSSTPPQLFTSEPIDPFVIQPGRRTSVEVTAQVVAAGPVPVTIQLTNSEGGDFGEPGQIVVQSSAYANAARVLVRIALAALLLAVAVHGVRRARRMRAAAARGAARARAERAPEASPPDRGDGHRAGPRLGDERAAEELIAEEAPATAPAGADGAPPAAADEATREVPHG